MKRFLKYFVMILVVGSLSSCEDWVDPQSVPYIRPNEATDNPELYAQYLVSLREYKSRDHKVTIGWFDNSLKQPISCAHNLVHLPDSVDFVSLIHPDNLTSWELSEMEEIRREKMTRIVYSVSYPDIEKAYNDYVHDFNTNLNKSEPSQPEEEVEPMKTFVEYMQEVLSVQLALSDKYPYDGLIFKFVGKSTDLMTDAEKAEYTERLEAYLAQIEAWRVSHSDKLLFFQGKPQYLLDKTILQSCAYIILETDMESNSGALSYNALSALIDGVPSDRFVVMARPYSKVNTTGHFVDHNNADIPAIKGCAYWVASPTPEFQRAGLGIYDISQDYYNTNLVYQYTREAIEIMNPHPHPKNN